jgi:cytochrome b involved in lipid metabolism
LEFETLDAQWVGDETSLKLLLQQSRQNDQLLEHEGPLADSLYRSTDELPESHREWDLVAAELSWNYRNLNARKRLDNMPVLPATEEALPDRYLARASSLLSIFAHAYWHNEHDNPVETLPESLLEPWKVVTRRLGRSVPTMNYMDLYTYNWSGVPNSVTRMRLRTPTTGSFAEQRFYLGTVAISNAGLPIIDLSVRAADEAEAGDEQALRITLEKITQCVRQMTEVFQFLSLQRNDAGFVDPVIWTHTVATFAMTFTQKIGLGDAIAPSGNSLPIIHYIDSFLGRKTYDSDLGRITHSFRDPAVMAPNHIACIKHLEQIQVRDFVANSAQDQRTKRAWNDLIRVYAGEHGFLKQHLKKVFGFVFTASLVGRPTTLLNIPLSILNFIESTDNVTQLLVTEMDQRQSLFLESGISKPVTPPGRSRQNTNSSKDKPVFNEIELAFHNTPEQGLWMQIGSDVVDVSSFLWQHPGGNHILEYMAGLDATHVYEIIHPNKPIPAEWMAGVFKPQPNNAPQIKLIRLLTLCMNVCQIEFRSICEHKCADDPAAPFNSSPPFDPAWTPYVSPINLMLLLRYFRKVYGQLFSGTLEAAKHYLAEDEIATIANSETLQRLRQTTTVPNSLRHPELPEWVGRDLHKANNILVAALNDVRTIVVSENGMSNEIHSALLEGLTRCSEPAGVVAEIYSEA